MRKILFKGIHIRKDLNNLIQKLNLRVLLMIFLLVIIAGVMIHRLFVLQIINGESYLDNFQLKIRREVSISPTRGNIYDRNGNLLAYNKMAYSVTINDQIESGPDHDSELNAIIEKTIEIVEKNEGEITGDFNIALSADETTYEYTVSGTNLLRFLADIYGYQDTSSLDYSERNTTADEMIRLLADRYGISEEGRSPQRLLQMITIRYMLSLNSYNKYISSTIAVNINENAVSEILENANILKGVDIEDVTSRVYVDGTYFCHILGYTGKISTSELEDYQAQGITYDANDIVGKSGIEKSMEAVLQGQKGSRTVYVDSVGRELESSGTIDPVPGRDVYLTIDKDLQEAAYDILEKKIAEILINNIKPYKEYVPDDTPSSSDVYTPIYDVYYAVINNSIVDTDHFYAKDAGPAEKQAGQIYDSFESEVLEKLRTELQELKTPYDHLTKEYKYYESYIASMLYEQNILQTDLVDKTDSVYQDWTVNETISLAEFLTHAVAQNWIDISMLEVNGKYSDSIQIYDALCEYILKELETDRDFTKLVYKYIILDDQITGTMICQILMEQDIVRVPAAEKASFESGAEGAMTFMLNRIRNLDLTPAQLALDPYSGSMVITDCNTGDVLALVSYPSYDNNKMSNGVDAQYYARLREDLSKPLINYATQQRTAPGSTFKPVSATAGLMEGVIDLGTEIYCDGIYLNESAKPKCWVYPAGHHALTVSGGIRNSCNVFFYDVGFRLGQVRTETAEGAAETEENLAETDAAENTGNNSETEYNSAVGIEKLARYAAMYGLDSTSGIEIEEADPIVSSEDAIRSAIGQGNSNYTTVGLARYVTTIANSGTCYDLTLIDHVADSSGSAREDYSAGIHGILSMDQSYWDAIHTGMRGVVEDMSFFTGFGVNVAGKTGTAQENVNRPNHALFICYAPYENPQIAVATRIANGYKSSNAAQITAEVLKYYFDLADKDELLSTETIVDVTVGD